MHPSQRSIDRSAPQPPRHPRRQLGLRSGLCAAASGPTAAAKAATSERVSTPLGEKVADVNIVGEHSSPLTEDEVAAVGHGPFIVLSARIAPRAGARPFHMVIDGAQ